MADTPPAPDAPEAYFNRELSWLAFARRVLALVEDERLPVLERVKFAGIMGMLHDEFFMKRVSGLKRQMRRGVRKLSLDGRKPAEEYRACREELESQIDALADVIANGLRPALERDGVPLLDHDRLDEGERAGLREYFRASVLPILTPLAVDSEHPFPFISNLGLNLAIVLQGGKRKRRRFVRVKVPTNRPRWLPLPDRPGFVPLEQVIAANADLLYPNSLRISIHVFQVTRGAQGETEAGEAGADDELRRPGSIVRQVSRELKARRFAGVVRLQVEPSMPEELRKWLAAQMKIGEEDIYPTAYPLGLRDLLSLEVPGRDDLRLPEHVPVTHERFEGLHPDLPGAIFEEIARDDLLLHHPYHDFDTSVVRFLQSAAVDPDVLAIKLTIYRTSSNSPIVQALAEAARSGKQVAVLVEITARFDEAPNIAWGRYLEQEGVHVSYGVERLKTHVKLALVVREERGVIHRYAHVGTGNYHTRTARVYEDLGILTADPETCDEVAAVFNALTGTTPHPTEGPLLVAPVSMRPRFTELIRREAEHAREGRPCGISAKMNQLQDPQIIRELYRASQAGVPISLNVRGLCCLRPGVPGLSDTVRVFGVVGRFLEHSRVYRFTNGGDPEHLLGSADWMKRNLDRRVETILSVRNRTLQKELDEILDTYDRDNSSVWDCGPDGRYTRRRPAEGEEPVAAQEALIQRVVRRPAEGANREEFARKGRRRDRSADPRPKRSAPPAP